MKIGIIGLGLIGGSLAKAIKESDEMKRLTAAADKVKNDADALREKFNKTYPDVEVKLQIEGWDGFSEKVAARIQAGNADCMPLVKLTGTSMRSPLRVHSARPSQRARTPSSFSLTR